MTYAAAGLSQCVYACWELACDFHLVSMRSGKRKMEGVLAEGGQLGNALCWLLVPSIAVSGISDWGFPFLFVFIWNIPNRIACVS